MHGDDDDADIRPAAADPVCRLDTTDARHVDIHEDDIDRAIVVATPVYRRLATIQSVEHPDFWLAAEQAFESETNQIVIIDDEHTGW
jgi:hypothetical protein